MTDTFIRVPATPDAMTPKLASAIGDPADIGLVPTIVNSVGKTNAAVGMDVRLDQIGGGDVLPNVSLAIPEFPGCLKSVMKHRTILSRKSIDLLGSRIHRLPIVLRPNVRLPPCQRFKTIGYCYGSTRLPCFLIFDWSTVRTIVLILGNRPFGRTTLVSKDGSKGKHSANFMFHESSSYGDNRLVSIPEVE